jgi:hypothetical protein
LPLGKDHLSFSAAGEEEDNSKKEDDGHPVVRTPMEW